MESRTFKCEEEGNDHMLHYEQVFGNVVERRESKFCALLMKHRLKVKDEQVIILQMDQQLKTKILMWYQDNYCVVSVSFFKFLLEIDSLY